jgi:hypothetical protein
MNERRGMHAVAERNNYHDQWGYAGAGEDAGCAVIDQHAIERDDQRDEFDREENEAKTVTGRPTETWRLLAEQLEPRIESMSHVVDGMQAAPYQVLRAGTMQICDPVNDLRVKVEAVRWMVRIAKHLNGVAREMVMATVSKSVEDMEFAIEAQTRLLAQQAAA